MSGLNFTLSEETSFLPDNLSGFRKIIFRSEIWVNILISVIITKNDVNEDVFDLLRELNEEEINYLLRKLIEKEELNDELNYLLRENEKK